MNPFETLGITASFDLDLESLEKRHRELSRVVHPDKFASSPAAERRRALSRAVDINDAWRVVRDPIRRAEALLRLLQVPVGETNEPKPSPMLLMEMLEIREELSMAAGKKDAAKVAELSSKAKQREQEIINKLSIEFRAFLAEKNPSDDQKHRLVATLGELRYARRFAEEASAIEDDLMA